MTCNHSDYGCIVIEQMDETLGRIGESIRCTGCLNEIGWATTKTTLVRSPVENEQLHPE
jgi:hypothetical protein